MEFQPVEAPKQSHAHAVADALAGSVSGLALGRLASLAAWIAAVQGKDVPGPFVRPRAVVVAGNHGVAARGLSAWAADAGATQAEELRAGGGPAHAAARLAGASLRFVDDYLDAPTGAIDVEPAISPEVWEAALERARVELEQALREHVINWVLKDADLERYYREDTKVLVNPSGSFIQGGPMSDAGLTGRKIIVDTYGGMARHGGGAFSGKDPSKVDRSAAYAMRWVAKNIVAAGLADRAEVQVAYAIGRAKPVGLYVETFGTAKEGLSDANIQAAVNQVFDLRPAAIIRELDLLRPIYAQTAAYGHFGRTDVELPWEQLNRVEALRAAAGL
mgnify:CR=1 FL=1